MTSLSFARQAQDLLLPPRRVGEDVDASWPDFLSLQKHLLWLGNGENSLRAPLHNDALENVRTPLYTVY